MSRVLDYFLLLALVLTTVLIVRGAVNQVTSAIRVGRIAGRGAVYERDAQPVMFWRGVVFWVVVSAAMIGVNIYAMIAVFGAAS